MPRVSLTLAAAAALAIPMFNAAEAPAQVRITEFMSEGQGDILSGNGGRRQREFFELTNLGTSPVNVAGWTYNDNNTNDPNNDWGNEIGSIAAGESIVFTQMTAADFRTYWGLAQSVRVFSFGQLSNLGNADTINIYNSLTQSTSTLVDSLTFTADARGSGVSRNRPWDGLTGQYANSAWVISSVGDNFQSRFSPIVGFAPNFPQPTTGFDAANYIDLGNPGVYIPAPGAAALFGLAAVGVARRRR